VGSSTSQPCRPPRPVTFLLFFTSTFPTFTSCLTLLFRNSREWADAWHPRTPRSPRLQTSSSSCRWSRVLIKQQLHTCSHQKMSSGRSTEWGLRSFRTAGGKWRTRGPRWVQCATDIGCRCRQAACIMSNQRGRPRFQGAVVKNLVLAGENYREGFPSRYGPKYFA
jgi:hypothetical protein